jgi:thiamine-phosphate pyrophosphorylase
MNPFEQSLLERMGEKTFQKIQAARIGVAGAGGLGSNCALFLARSGFKHFVLVDFDVIDASNLNRQFYFLHQLGLPKADTLKTNLLAINPDLDIRTHTLRLDPKNLKAIFETCTVVVEAFDTVAEKKMLAETYWHSDKLLVSASGLAGWGDADSIRIQRPAKNFFLVGDLTTGVAPNIPPMAPRVNVAAAKQADIVLAWVLEGDYRKPHSLAAKAALLATDLYGITAEKYSLGRSNEDVVAQMLQAGIKIIQYREKEKSLKEKLAECRTLRALTRKFNAAFIINDDISIAQLVDADGVHIGQDDLPIESVRAILGHEKIIGLSTHSPAQLQAAIKRGADYIGVGPLYTTQTKVNVCAAVGLEYLDYARKNATIPFVAIGGIKEHNLADVVRHGATCVALVTEIVGAEDIAEKVMRLKSIIRKQPHRTHRRGAENAED